MKCKECHHEPARIERKGFLQQKIYPLLGYYPWRCHGCGSQMLFRNRGLIKGRRHSASEGNQISSVLET
jgi:hypothetical protein